MLSQQFQPLLHKARRQSFLLFCLLIALHLWSSPATFAQVKVEGACPAACGIKIQITNATLTEANDGMLVKVEWTLAQTAPEIKLKNLTIFARVKLGIDSVENTLTVASTARQATLKLSRNLEFDFKDVEVLTTKVTAFAEALPPIPITNIPSKKITGQGNDSAVEVTWGTPPPLPCTASSIAVSVAATNEKGDRLTGTGNKALNVRSATIEVKGDTNKKGLRNPEATVQVINSLIGCEEIKNFPPKQTGISGGTGSTAASSAKVTLANLSLIKESSERVTAKMNWDVFEPTSFKATDFALKFDQEDASGKSKTFTVNIKGNERSFEAGGIASPDNIRNLTVTITATFKDNANTQVLTREDKKTQPFNLKQAVKPAVQLSPTVPKPVVPPVQSVGLDLTNVKISSAANLHRITAVWQVNIPTGITVTSFEIEAQVAGIKTKANRSAVVLGKERQATVNFTFDEVGNKITNAQVKVIANARRVDGSTFQQTATRSGN